MRNPPGQGPAPYGGDPSPTQPIPIVIPGAPVPPLGSRAPGGPAGGPGMPPGAAYDHRQGFWASHLLARLLAFAIDIPGIAFVLAAFGFDLVDHGSLALAPRHEVGGWTVLVLLSLGIAFAFAFLCEAVLGTTLGKALFMLHVRRADGRREGFGRAVMRYLLLPVDLLLIGPLLALVTPKHRRLGDFVSGTVVGRSPIGPVATALAAILLGVLGYAQAAYGGGFTSVLGIGAETTTYLPLVLGGLTLPGLRGVPEANASAAPSPDAFASASPSALETAPATFGAASPAPDSSVAPQATAAPSASAVAPSDAPTSAGTPPGTSPIN